MAKKIIFQILNSFRVIAFWIFISLIFVSIVAAREEMKVTVTVEDGVLGDRINNIASGQEFICVCNGKNITVFDTIGREKGDKVQVIFRDGEYYALVDPENPKIGVDKWDRINYKFNMATGGNWFFTFAAYIFFLVLTIKSRKEFRNEYPILLTVTHVFGLISVFLFYIYCFWIEFFTLILYAVVFAIIWINRIVSHNLRRKMDASAQTKNT